VDNVKSLNILLCQALLTMRRHEGVIIKRTVGALESLLFVYFLGEQKIDTAG